LFGAKNFFNYFLSHLSQLLKFFQKLFKFLFKQIFSFFPTKKNYCSGVHNARFMMDADNFASYAENLTSLFNEGTQSYDIDALAFCICKIHAVAESQFFFNDY